MREIKEAEYGDWTEKGVFIEFSVTDYYSFISGQKKE